jgi:hyperosmotically inducible periplasmic protein
MRASLVIVFGLIASAGSSAAADNLVREVRHELLLVRGYTAFDWLTYRVDGNKVTLLGAAVRADLKRDAENAVKSIGGVGSVQNDIEVLPASATDDLIRHGILQSIDQQMFAYLAELVKQIHIIVKNGNVTLEGEVSSQADKDKVSALAKHVQQVRGVTNNLVVQK